MPPTFIRFGYIERALAMLTFGYVLAGASGARAQAVKGKVSPDLPPPVLTYHGLVPGFDTVEKVRKTLGQPEFEAPWYSYKMYYPAKGRPGLYDALHTGGKEDAAGLANIDAASVPEGYETEELIRRKLGEPEFELRMATWKLLDYSAKGLRFGLSPKGATIGVAYFPHGWTRVPQGERKLIDLSNLRQGPQPKPATPASLGGLRAGATEVIYSPTGEKWLGQPYKVHDDLKGRIAVFSDGKLTVALVGADLFGMGWDNLKVIRDAAKKAGVDQTIIGMSHNHAAGDTIGVYGHYPAEYIAHIQEQISKGIAEAVVRMKPVAEFRTASRELPMDGIRVQDLFRNARNPGVLDPTISILQAIGEDGKPITTLVNFACHVESLGYKPLEVSADFPGYMCEQMKQDGMGQPVFLNGAVGGMVSGDNRERTHESSRQMGLKLASIVKELGKTAQPPSTFKFSAEVRDLEIPLTNPRFKPMFSSGLRKLKRGRVLTDMTLVRLGEAQIVSLPGELLPEVSFEILEEMDGFPRVLVGLANDEMGYMLPPYDFRDDAYEETMSMGPATALMVRDAAIRMVQGVR